MQPQVTPSHKQPHATPAALRVCQLVALGGLKAAEVSCVFALSDNKSAWSQPGGDHGGSSGCPRRRYGLKFIFKF